MSKNDVAQYDGTLFDGVGEREVKFIHSKKSIENRIAMVQSIVRAGNADFARCKADEGFLRALATGQADQLVFFQGRWCKRKVVKALVVFMDSWEARLRWYQDEVKSLWSSWDLAE